MKQQSLTIGINVLAKHGKQSRIDSICFDELDGSYDYCKVIFQCSR